MLEQTIEFIHLMKHPELIAEFMGGKIDNSKISKDSPIKSTHRLGNERYSGGRKSVSEMAKDIGEKIRLRSDLLYMTYISYSQRNATIHIFLNNNKPAIDDKYVRPSRAAEIMKAVQSISQTLYIFGMAGYGKTTLVADFLARRGYCYYSISEVDVIQNMLQDLETITGETGTGHGGRRPTIVIDNLHLLETTEGREQCCKIIDKIAGMNGLWLILISKKPGSKMVQTPLY